MTAPKELMPQIGLPLARARIDNFELRFAYLVVGGSTGVFGACTP